MRTGLPPHDSLRRHIRHNLVGYVALFIALGGTGAYAADEWTGENIQNETLTGADVEGKGGNATTQAVNGTIAGADIAGQAPNDNGQPFVAGTIKGWDVLDRSLKPDDIAADSLTDVELAPGSVGSSEVKDESLTRADYFELYGFSARINRLAASGTQYGAIEGLSNAGSGGFSRISPNLTSAAVRRSAIRIHLTAPVASGATRSFNLNLAASQGGDLVPLCTVDAGEQDCTGGGGVHSLPAHARWQLRTTTTGTPNPPNTRVDALVKFNLG